MKNAMFRRLFLFVLFAGVLGHSGAAQEIIVDCNRSIGTLRALHGINGGVLCDGETVDLTDFWKEAEFPLTRLHDCQWPAPAVVDVHAIFPDFRNDPADAASYRFGPTDDYLAAIHQTKTHIVYRLGESIEHTKTKHFVHPPRDPEKWAEVCLHVMKHYRDGWADGFRHDIRYWEIWNEPENKPQMWTGTDAQFFTLYVITAKKLKAAFPECKIGGPSIGAALIPAENGGWKMSPYAKAFLDYVKKHDAPLDFFSWHTYTDRPAEYAEKAKAVREYLDRLGFTACESHLNEWNYLPDNDWEPMLAKNAGRRREAWFHRIGGAEGAAFLASVLIALQDAPITAANYYSGDNSPFGLFTEHGAAKKTFFVMKAFRQFLDTPQRLAISGELSDGKVAAAGMNAEKKTLAVVISNTKNSPGEMAVTLTHVPWQQSGRCEIYCVDEDHDLEKIREVNTAIQDGTLKIRCPAPAHSVLLIKIFPAESAAIPSAEWEKYSENPVLGGELGTCFDVTLLHEDGLYKMWFSWRPKKSIAYTHSEDGVHWAAPVVVLEPRDGWEADLNRPGVIKKDGLYHMWYTGQADGESRIGYAVSENGTDWRRKSDTPVLIPEEPWEKVAVMCSHVLWDEEAGRYKMWYSAGEQYEPNAMGYAVSRDGVTWEKHAANPIFTPDKTLPWEQHKVTAAQVMKTPVGYTMFYIGFENEHLARIGLAQSLDGVTDWQRHPANPIISPTPHAWDHDACYKPYAIYHPEDKTWRLWYNGRHGASEQIGMAVHPGEDLGFPPHP